MSLIRSFVAIVSILTLTTQNVLAVSYPSTGPSGAFSGGSFGTYLQNLITNPCPPGEVVSGFSTGSSNYGEPICAVMNLSSGGATGDTLRYDGSSWVANSVIYNDGINVGIGNVGPASKLDVAGVLTVNPGAFGDAINFYNGYKIRTVGGGGIQIQGSPYVAIGNTSGLNGATFSIGNTGAAMLTLYPDVGQYGLVVSGYDFAVDSEGNLGIGTTSPNTKLEISSTRDNAFRINKTGGTNWSYMEWLYGGTRKYWQGLNALGNYAIESDTSTGQIFISGSRISIGVVNPSYRLDVAPGYVNSASGFCINGDCLPAWSFVSDYINGNPGYLAGYDSIGTLGSSNMYQSGTKLFIGDIPYILSGSMTNPGYLSIYSVSGSSSSNPMISMGQPGYPDCKIWVNGSSVLESNCSIGMFDTSLSVNPNQLIRADEYGTGLAGSVIYESGSFIGIGTSDPSAKLEVVGQIKITGGSPGIGKVLTSDASGLANWQSPGSLSFTGVASFNSRTGVVIGASGDYSAGQISNTAAGNIAATNVQAALNELDTEKQITITGAATSVTLANLSPNAALVSDLSGKIGASATISTTELGYLDAVTSSVQDQLDAKEPTITSGLASQYYRGDKSWQTLNTAAVPESGNLYFSNARVWSALSGAISEYLTGNMIVNRALISDPSGKIDASSTISTTELGYLDNTTSNIQGQLDDLTLNKADLASPALTGTPSSPTAIAGTNTTQIATTSFVNTAVTNGTTPAALAGKVWTLSGNTVGVNDFFGSTNAQDIVLKTNSIERLRVTAGGNIFGLGYDATGFSGTNSIAFGSSAGYGMVGDYNIAVGGDYNGGTASGSYNMFLGGYGAGDTLRGDYNFVAGGVNPGLNLNGKYNTALGGMRSGRSMFGSSNTAIGGSDAGYFMTGVNNVAFGGQSAGLLMNGLSNVAVGGQYTGWGMSGSYNLALGGAGAGTGMTSGSHNIYMGSYAIGNAGQSNQFSIGNVIYGSGMGTGGLANGMVGIGTMTPSAKLQVVGTTRLDLGSDATGDMFYRSAGGNLSRLALGTAGKILTSSGGVPAWGDAAAITAPVDSVFGRTGSVIGASGDYTAGQITNVAGGTISATNVQTAITELDTEKAPLASPALTGIPTAPTAASGTNSTQIATTAFVIDQGYLTGFTENDPKIGPLAPGYIPKWNGFFSQLMDSQVYDNGTSVGIGTSTPGTYKLNVNGDAFVSGSLTILDRLYVDSIVNRSVTNLTLSGNLLPDNNAPLSYRNIGSDSSRWNNLYLSGQVTIGGGSPANGKVLVSDSTGLASWQTLPSTVDCTASGSGLQNTCIGSGALQRNTDGSFNVAFGEDAMASNSGGDINAAFGHQALKDNTEGTYNTAIGAGALKLNTTGIQNTAVGANALGDNTFGDNNAAFGEYTMRQFKSGSYNTAIGQNNLWNLHAGSYNISLGNANEFLAGTGNIVIGNSIILPDGSVNQLSIGNWIYGNNGNIGIGQSSGLNDKLTVAGTGSFQGLKILSGASNGYVLTSDASGNARWAIPTGGDSWSLSGNAIGVNDFIGSTNNQDVVIKVNNAQAGRFSTNGNLSLGLLNTTPLGWGESTTIGYSNTNNGSWGLVAGRNNNSITGSDYAVVYGHSNTLLGSYSSVFGYGNNLPYNESSMAIGRGNNFESNIFNVIAVGEGNNATNGGIQYRLLIGFSNTGSEAATAAIGYNNNVAGYSAMAIGRGNVVSASGAAAIGTNLTNSIVGSLQIGPNEAAKITVLSGGQVGIGTMTPGAKFEVAGGDAIINGLTVGVGKNGSQSTAVGYQALGSNTVGPWNTAIGYMALATNSGGGQNAALGTWALRNNTSGVRNTGLGMSALYNNTGGSYNTAIGNESLIQNYNGDYNTALGFDTLQTLTAGVGNVALGANAGSNQTSGSSNIIIGYNAQVPNTTGSNQLSIGGWIYGSGGTIGIGTSSLGTSAKLKVEGQIEITGGSPGAGKVLTSDATGLASWQSMSGTSVSSVFGRTGAVVSASGDYTAGQITNVAGGNISATNVQAALNELDSEKQVTITGAASTVALANLTASSALVSDSNGKITTLTGLSVVELGYVNGVTSNIQTQLSLKEPAILSPVVSPTSYYFRGDKSWQNLNTDVTNALTGAVSNSLVTNLTTNSALISDAGGKIAISPTISSTELGYLDNATSNIQTQLNSKVSTGAVNGTTNYVPKFNGTNSITDSQIYDDGSSVGIGMLPAGDERLFVNGGAQIMGSTYIAGDLTLTGSLFVDSIVNRSVTNLTISGNILPDSNAPLAYRNLGSNTQRWNNLYLTGQITIGGGSPGAGKVLTSDANGLATWTAPSSTVWTLSGNSIGANDFIGSTNSQDVVMKRNNIEGLRLAQTGTYISGSLQVGNSLNATNIPGYTTSLYGPTAGYLVLGINGGTAMTIDYGGNVAVGAMATTKNFEVNAGADLTFRLNSGNASWWDFTMNYGVNKNLYLTPATGTGDFIFTGTSVGIGQAPTSNERLYVAGTGTFQGLKILSGASNGYVLTSDASGNARWAAASGGASTGWTLSGNAIGANDFAGTTNAQPFIVKTNNIEKARFYSSATNNAILSLTGGGISITGSAIIIGDTSGNARPKEAIDMQFARSSATQVASGSGTTVIGGYNTAAAANPGTSVMGYANTYTGGASDEEGAIVLGSYNNIASGFGPTVVLGTNNTSNAQVSTTIIGSYNYAPNTSNDITIVGEENSAYYHRAQVFGRNNTAGEESVVIGSNNLMSEAGFPGTDYNIALGIGNTTTTDIGLPFITNVTLVGLNNTGSAVGAYVFGSGITNSVEGSVQIGTNNATKITLVSSGALGIGTSTPTSKLDVVGTGTFQGLKILSGATSGYVLTSDASGNARWAAASGGASTGWTLSGNAIGANDFIGSTNAQDVVLKSNNIERLRITGNSGNILGLGYSTVGTMNNSLALGTGAGDSMKGNYSVALGGYRAGYSMSGANNTAIGGVWAGYDMRGTNNSAFGGGNAGRSMDGTSNSAFGGSFAGESMNGLYNAAFGGQTAGYYMTGYYNSAFGGRYAGFFMDGLNNAAYGGDFAGYYMTGSYNTAMGGNSAGFQMNGSYNSAFGGVSPGMNMNGIYNTAVGGLRAGYTMLGTYNVALGTYAGQSMSGSDNVYIGSYATGITNGNNQFSIGNVLYGTGMGTGGLANGRVGIGTSTPTSKLDVVGTGTFQGLKILSGASNGYVLTSDSSGNARWAAASAPSNLWTLSGNTVGVNDFIGSTNGQDVVIKANNVEGLRLTKSGNLLAAGGTSQDATYSIAMGSGAGRYMDGLNNTAIGGSSAGYYMYGTQNTAIGGSIAGYGMRGLQNSAFGGYSPGLNTLGIRGTVVGGYEGGYTMSGFHNTAVGGYQAGQGMWGSVNTAIGGYMAGYTAVGNFNLAMGGMYAGEYGNGDYNISMGTSAGRYMSGTHNVYIGSYATGVTNGSNQFSIGNVIYGTGMGANGMANGRVGMGTITPTSKLDVVGTGTFQGLKILSGASNGYVLTSDASGNARWAAASGGASTGWTLSGNVIGVNDFIGSTNGQDVVIKANNVEGLRLTKSGNIIGLGGAGGTAVNSIIVGNGAGSSIAGSYNSALGGQGAGSFMNGSYNSAFGGSYPGTAMTGSYNSALGGLSAGNYMDGTYNIAIGTSAGQYMSGSDNVYIGSYATGVTNGSNQFSIGNVIYGTGMGANGMANGRVGMGTITPTTKLDVVGTGTFQGLKILSGASNGYVLTSDTSGNARWAAASAPSNLWTLSGNTVGVNDFIGSTNAQDVVIKANNTERLRVTSAGNIVGLGGTAGTATLSIGIGTFAGGSMLGTQNYAIGYGAGQNMSGSNNTVMGGNNAGNGMNGNYNSAIGGSNVGLGMNGNYNSAFGGDSAGYSMKGAYNSAFGGVNAGSTMSGTYNVAIGTAAGTGMISGQDNVYIGSYAIGNTGQSNQFSLGNVIYGSGMGAAGLTNGMVGIGTITPSQKLEVSGNVLATSYMTSSDRSLKENIIPLPDALAKILSLRGYSFNWKKDGREDIGIIAQEVEAVYPEIVHTDPNTGTKSVEYANLIAPMIEAMREQQNMIDTQQREIDELKSTLKEVQSSLQK